MTDLICYNKMIQQRLPSQISYPNIVPKGFPSVYKQWNLDPMSSNKIWVNNDIVRFNFMNMGTGVFDPYRSYIQITVSTNTTDTPVGGFQIDNSAQSFFDQLVLYSKSKQIQRITTYSILAAYLNDIGLNQFMTQGRQVQGLGYGSFDTMPFQRGQGSGTTSIRRQGTASNYSGTYSNGNIFPTIGNAYPQNCQYYNMNSLFNCMHIAKGHVTNSNPAMTGSDYNGGNNSTAQNATLVQTMLYYLGYSGHLRAQYNAKFIENKFPESTQSIPCFQLQLLEQVSNNNFPFKFNANNPYTTSVRRTITDSLYFDTSHNSNTHFLNCANYGFASLFCPFYTRGTFQPFISATVPQIMMNYGIYLQTKIPIYRKKFKVPLISSVLGVLIPPQQFLLIPLAAINQCLLQLTLDPYAMFTTGYQDYSQFDDVGMGNQQPRNYTIQRIRYNLQTYHFIDTNIQSYLQSSLTRQITILSNFWSLSNQYQIPGGNGVNGSYIIGANATHLNQIVVLFVANDYQKYSFARKHFRLSNCISRAYTKIGVQYWPPQPYKGNGGNVQSNNVDDDNSIFVENIYQLNHYMFSKAPLPRINPYNFAVNQRPYDVTNKNPMYPSSMIGNQNFAFSASTVNADTAMGMSWIHENRVVGKAAYVFSYTPFAQSDFVLQGINVTTSNFQVVFESQTQFPFDRDQTMYIYYRSSGITKYTSNGIITVGR